MKKQHISLIMNIILILGILGGVGFALFNAINYVPDNNIENKVSTVQEATTAEKVYKIGIIQHTNNPECNACHEGFVAKLAQRGFVNSNNIEIDYVLEENEKKCIEAMKKMVDEKCDLIYSIGGFTTSELSKLTTDIPIVFAAISDPEAEEYIQSNENPGGNITGVSSFIPTFEQIDSISFLLPDAKSIGAIYDGTNEFSTLQVYIAKSEAESELLDLNFEKYPILESSEISERLEEVVDDGIDVLFLPVDSLINEDIDSIIDFCNENKIPTICGEEEMLSDGGFSTTVINYSSIGRKAADIAVDILVNGADPASTPIAYKYECDTKVNKNTLEKLDLSLSNDAIKKCEIKEY